MYSFKKRGSAVSLKREKSKSKQLKVAHDEYVKSRADEVKAIQTRKVNERGYINTCLTQFSDKKERKKLLKYGKKFCYSPEKLNQIEEHFTAWNMDDVDINTVEDVYELQIFINERVDEQNFVDRFFNIFHKDEGDNYNDI